MALADCIVSGLAWRDGVLTDQVVTGPDLSAHASDDTVVWVDLLHPTPSDLAELAERLDLAPTTIEDAVAPHERPKVTRHGDHLFFTVYSAHLDVDQRDAGDAGGATRAGDDGDDGNLVVGHIRSARISGFVLPHALVTLRLDDSFDMEPVVARWQENADLLRFGVGALVHGLLDAVVDGHFETIQALDTEVEELEDHLFAERRTGHEFAQSIYRFRKDLVALRRIVLPMREVVNAILRHRGRTGSDLDHWYDDLYDHVLRASEWTESLRDMATTVFETNLSLQDARLNVVMKKLAGWGAIIAIPTAVTGWFGQNVPYPGFSAPLGLWSSVVLIVVLAGALYVSFKRRDWL